MAIKNSPVHQDQSHPEVERRPSFLRRIFRRRTSSLSSEPGGGLLTAQTNGSHGKNKRQFTQVEQTHGNDLNPDLFPGTMTKILDYPSILLGFMWAWVQIVMTFIKSHIVGLLGTFEDKNDGINFNIYARVERKWFQIPVAGDELTVGELGGVALKRYQGNKLNHAPISDSDKIVSVVRKAKGGAILDPEDLVKDVLIQGDFVSVAFLEGESHKIQFDHEKEIESSVQDEVIATGERETHVLDGNSLSPEDLMQLGRGSYKIQISADSLNKVEKARSVVDEIVKENRVVYGINTGFGKFARTVIPPDKIVELQENLIRSHAAGVGQPLTPSRTRMLLALRINVLAKGYSGVSPKTLLQLVDAFNCSCLSWVPEQGTVGASGDLAPLAHLALGLMGEGRMWSPSTGWGEAANVLGAHGLSPISLGAKEGLALINGTQLLTSLGGEAVTRAGRIARQADVVAALSMEVLKGTPTAFDPDCHKIRPHKGQGMVAARLRALLHSETHPSEIAGNHGYKNRVQDAYTIRCTPQVHGIVHDTIDWVRGILTTEMNSASDNPIVFGERREIISAGNFHGEYPAKVCDYLAIGVHELSSMSERRTERLVNPSLSELPAFLTMDGGLNSGFMIAHCTAAALVSENKVLCHPASVDSLSTSAGTEDHVSMGGFAARKALSVVANVERVIAIELLAACQALEFYRPLKTMPPLEAVYKVVRSVAKPWDKDRYMAPDIENVTQLLKQDMIWDAVSSFVEEYEYQNEDILNTQAIEKIDVKTGFTPSSHHHDSC